MVITATDFQLRVNEYFTKLIKGEEIVIERYGKKFAVLVPFSEYEKTQSAKTDAAETTPVTPQSVVTPVTMQQPETKGDFSRDELVKIVKGLLGLHN